MPMLSYFDFILCVLQHPIHLQTNHDNASYLFIFLFNDLFYYYSVPLSLNLSLNCSGFPFKLLVGLHNLIIYDFNCNLRNISCVSVAWITKYQEKSINHFETAAFMPMRLLKNCRLVIVNALLSPK